MLIEFYNNASGFRRWKDILEAPVVIKLLRVPATAHGGDWYRNSGGLQWIHIDIHIQIYRYCLLKNTEAAVVPVTTAVTGTTII